MAFVDVPSDAEPDAEPDVEPDAEKGWTYQTGSQPHMVTAFERANRKGVVTLRWWSGAKKRYHTRSLGIRMRDSEGSLIIEQVAEVIVATTAFQAHLQQHGSPPPAVATTQTGSRVEASAGVGVEVGQDPEAITFADGLAAALDVPSGMYPVETEHVKELRRAERDILRAIRRLGRRPRDDTDAGPKVLTASTLWRHLRYRAVRELWQEMARAYKSSSGERGGRSGPSVALS